MWELINEKHTINNICSLKKTASLFLLPSFPPSRLPCLLPLPPPLLPLL